jgi:hypothetical protein
LAIEKAGKMSDKYPPRSETELQLEARVIALEYLLKHCLWNLIIQQTNADEGDDVAAVNEARLFRKLCRESLKRAAFAGVDPTLSDHVTALVSEHVERVLGELVQEMEERLAQGGLPSRGSF